MRSVLLNLGLIIAFPVWEDLCTVGRGLGAETKGLYMESGHVTSTSKPLLSLEEILVQLAGMGPHGNRIFAPCLHGNMRWLCLAYMEICVGCTLLTWKYLPCIFSNTILWELHAHFQALAETEIMGHPTPSFLH